MKRYIFIALLTFLFLNFSIQKIQAQATTKLVELCANKAGDDATYLKDFVVELDASGPDEKPPQSKYSLVLNKNNMYRFSICNEEGSPGKAKIEVFDMNRLLVSTYNIATGQEYNPVNFQCQKTGVYHIFISIIDGKRGSAVAILSFVKSM